MKEAYLPTYVKIGEKLRNARLLKNWTQKDLANRCKSVNREKISKIENAREDYMLSTLLEVCEALEISPEDLFGG